MEIELTPNEKLCKYFYEKGLDLYALLSSGATIEAVRGFDIHAFREDTLTLFTVVQKFNEDILIPPDVDVHIILQPRYMPVKSHCHDFIEFVYVFEGKCTQYINDIEYPADEGDLFLLAPDTYHHISTYEDDCMVFYVMARKSTFEKVFLSLLGNSDLLSTFFAHIIYEKNQNAYLLFKTAHDWKVRYLFLQMYLDSIHKDTYSAHMLNIQFELLCVHILRNHMASLEFNIANKSSNKIVAILNYLSDNYKSISIQEMGKHFNYSSNYLQHLIKKATGCTFGELVNKIRLDRACKLLKNRCLTIQEIGESVGFTNIRSFYRIFKKNFEISPAEYRKQEQGKKESENKHHDLS